jgi:hypothetical protein
MALFGKVFLFSEVEGVVVHRGQPVAGATVERSYHWGWKDQTFSSTVATDASGRFSFPEDSRSSMGGSLLPHEPLITQKILIRHDGRQYEAWIFTKRNYDQNGELKGRKIRLTCDLDRTPSHTGKVYGICTVEE